MFFDKDDDFFEHGYMENVRREIFTVDPIGPYALRNAPTHTEDGIPIRKLYVSNLPPKTTRTELFGVFAQYGFIKSCWLRMGEKGPNEPPTPTYAFVTFSDPVDAHKALKAPDHEKMLRGRNLRISPADSWHQPAVDADGRVRWRPRENRREASPSAHSSQQNIGDQETVSTSNTENDIVEASSSEENSTPSYTILDILNTDCLNHILSYVQIRDIIRSEVVSKQWQSMIQEYLQSVRTFKTSWWSISNSVLTTAVLRRVLQRIGASLTRLHIDHYWSALNDRTAHTVGKFCPNLEELKVVGMDTKNWNPLIYGCKQLKHLSFVSCNKLADSSLVQLMKKDCCLESLTVANNTHVTGLFLTGSYATKLTSLSFYNCYSLQGTVLSAAIESLPNLTCLKVDVRPATIWKFLPDVLMKLSKLEELSLSEYTSTDVNVSAQEMKQFCDAIASLTELKHLNLSRNICITDAVLKQISLSCPKLESLNVSCCNSRKIYSNQGVGDVGVSAVCTNCTSLRRLDVSYLGSLTPAGLSAVTSLRRLRTLTARGVPALSSEPLATCLTHCHELQELDACGCEGVSTELISAAVQALNAHPRPVTLHLASTAITTADELETHKLLTVNLTMDHSSPHLRPDFLDQMFNVSSTGSYDESLDGSLDDLFFEQNDFGVYDHFDADDENFLDEENEFNGVFEFGHKFVLM